MAILFSFGLLQRWLLLRAW